MNPSSDQGVFDSVGAKFRDGDLAGARAECEHFLAGVADTKRQSWAHFWLGAIEARSGAHAIAAEHFELGLATNRRNPFWLLQAGLTYFHLSNRERAERLYRDALRREPRYAIAHYNLGVLLQQNANAKSARRAFEAAITHQPQFAEAHTNLANTLVVLGDLDGAESHYRQALTINPQLANAHYGLGLHHLRRQQREAASDCFEAALKYNPSHLDAWLDLAECHHLASDEQEALVCIEEVLGRDPGNNIARFKRAQFSGQQPDSVPHEMIERLYGGMAGTFDMHLTQRLGYRIPSLLIAALAPWLTGFTATNSHGPAVLDLGCGTGLFGVAVRHFASRLTGVDLSPAMLAKAREHGIYDELVESDLQSFLLRDEETEKKFDLVTATDVLIYIGSIDFLFPHIAARLLPGGLFAFSTESPKQLGVDYRLEPSGRYVHSIDYINRLADTAGFDVMKCIETVIRTENAMALDGHIFILQKR